jgi:hypothetical protein
MLIGGMLNGIHLAGAQTLPTVTVTATDANASDLDANTGTFTIHRTGDTTAALTVAYTVGGTATAGVDYNALSGSATISAGASNGTIVVTPLIDSAAEGSEAVTVTVSASSAYTVGTPSTATITIFDARVGHQERTGETVDKPGWGWGDQNHNHFGPPGQGCSEDNPCHGNSAFGHSHHSDNDIDDDDDVSAAGVGQGHGHANVHSSGHGHGHND